MLVDQFGVDKVLDQAIALKAAQVENRVAEFLRHGACHLPGGEFAAGNNLPHQAGFLLAGLLQNVLGAFGVQQALLYQSMR